MALKIAAHRRFAENGGVCLILHAKDIDKIADILDNPRKTNPGTFLFDSSQSHKAPIENIVLRPAFKINPHKILQGAAHYRLFTS